MTETYRVLAWDATTVRIGTLRGADLDVAVVRTGQRFRDIRNCSAPAHGAWAVVVGVDASTTTHTLWRVDLASGAPEPLVEADYLLYCVVPPAGSPAVYTGPPYRSPADLSLYVLDIATRRQRLVLEGVMARSCVPSWRSPTRILIHTQSREVAEVNVVSGELKILFPGEYPAAAPDGVQIAYRVGQAVRLVGGDRVSVEIAQPRGVRRAPYRGAMSWSPDGQLLLLSRTAGTLGYELDFCTLDVGTRKFTRIRQRYMSGIVFY